MPSRLRRTNKRPRKPRRGSSAAKRLAEGFVYPRSGTELRSVKASFRGSSRSTLGFLPDLELAPLFSPVARCPRPYFKYCQVIIGHQRFLVTAFRHRSRPINQAVSAISEDLIWRGELAVFGLGTVVPYLASPGTIKNMDDAVTLYVTRALAAYAMGEQPPTLIQHARPFPIRT